MGVFQTWLSKGLQGPIPPFDSQIESVAAKERGYVLNLRMPGGPVRVFLDKDYLVTEIASADGRTDERPKYAAGTDGLILVGNDATDDSEQQGRTEVKYEIENSVLDGLRVPSYVHLRVNQNIDTRFSLDACVVKKGMVIHVNPPPSAKTK